MDVASLFSTPEGAVFERKSRLLVVENATDEEHKDGRSDFVRHTVAMANYSRLSGRKGYIVFGITDEKHTEPLQVANNGKGILNQSAISSNDDPWPEDLVKRNEYWKTHVQEPYEKMIHTYILPSRSSIKNGPKLSELNFSLESLSHQEGLLALLTIEPTPTKDPFFVKDYRKLGLSRRHFVRVNDNSIGIAEEDVHLLTRWTNEPYLPHTTWRRYLQQLKENISDAFPTDIHMPATYQNIRVEGTDCKGPCMFDTIWQEKLTAETGSNKFTVFIGEPGAGKTWCLKRKIFQQADVALTELTNDDTLLEPTTLIPVYVELRRYEGNKDFDQVIADKIAETLRNAGIKISRLDRKILHARQLRFLIAIDAADELPERGFEKAIQKVDTFVDSYSAINNAVTTREFLCPQNWFDNNYLYRVLPLSGEQIRSFLESRLTQSELSSPRLALLLEELLFLLPTPRLLQAFVDYLETYPIPSAGTAIKEILERIKKTEKRKATKSKDSYDDLWDYIFKYALMCLEHEHAELYEKQNPGLKKRALQFHRNAGLLERFVRDNNNMIRFTHIEYLDHLNAQKLLSLEYDPSKESQRQKKHLKTALTKKPDHLIRTTRYLLNMTDGDISQPPWVEWLHRLADPILQLRIIAERQNSQFGELSVLETILLTLVEKDHDHPSCMYWLHVLLQDLNTQIASRVLEKLDKSHVALSEQQILSLLHDPSQSYDLQWAALSTLLRTELASGRREARRLIANWLSDPGQPGQIGDALALVARFDLSELSDTVYEIGTSELPYPKETRENAQAVLKKLADPRHEELEKLLHPINEHVDPAPDDYPDAENEPATSFGTSLTTLPDPPSDTEVPFKEEE